MKNFPVESGAADMEGLATPASGDWAGEALRSTLKLLAVPMAFALAIVAWDLRLPGYVLYGVAGIFGLVLLSRVFRDAEPLLAVAILYLPLNKTFVAPLLPGINGTNALLLLLIAVWGMRASREERPLFQKMANTALVGMWAAVSLLSVVTAIFTLGFGYVVTTFLGDIKGWVDQFIVFFAFINLIRDGAMARRVAVYMLIGMAVALALGAHEWLDKRFLDRIEKARVMGPQLQPNDYGAFLVIGVAPFLGLFLAYLREVRAWFVFPPFFLVLAKVTLATFSRGAYLAMALAAVAMGYVRGKLFLLGAALFGIILLLAMPQLIPESLTERMAHTTTDSGHTQELDASSQNRLILWNAAIDMSLESPILGKGFGTFPILKGRYTEYEVRESDNHNMYLYISSQMGIPALLLFVWLLWSTYRLGARIYRGSTERFAQGLGLGGVALAAGVAMFNMFGSRMVDISVTAYFWIYLAVLAHLWAEIPPRDETADAET